jgi:hypothetical protein
MSDDDHYNGILLEEIRDQNKAVLEVVVMMQDQMSTLATKSDLQAVADDVSWIKLALKDTNKDLKNLAKRVTVLEQAA